MAAPMPDPGETAEAEDLYDIFPKDEAPDGLGAARGCANALIGGLLIACVVIGFLKIIGVF